MNKIMVAQQNTFSQKKKKREKREKQGCTQYTVWPPTNIMHLTPNKTETLICFLTRNMQQLCKPEQ